MVKKNSFVFSVVFFFIFGLTGSQKHSLPDGFVYLIDVDPSIITNVRYATNDNFVGRSIMGYKKPIIILTKEAAIQLKKVQKRLQLDGYSLVVYDAYRPQKAVDDFVKWSNNSEDQKNKDWFYPRINKKDVFVLGYVAKSSGHSRGSTVDLTLILLGQELHSINPALRKINDGYPFLFLDDGTVDMGSSFDMFDKLSHYENGLINQGYQDSRKYLKEIMNEYGFANYSGEWWHFTLRNEPYPNTYFDFDIE